MPGLPSLQQAGSVGQNQPHKQQRHSEKTQEGADQVPNPLCCGHGDAIHLEEACTCKHASRHRLHTCFHLVAQQTSVARQQDTRNRQVSGPMLSTSATVHTDIHHNLQDLSCSCMHTALCAGLCDPSAKSVTASVICGRNIPAVSKV